MIYVELQSWVENFYAKLFQDLVQDEDFPALKIFENVAIESTYIEVQYYFTSTYNQLRTILETQNIFNIMINS